MGASRAMARQTLTNWWGNVNCPGCSQPPALTGDGGTAHEDKVIGVRRIIRRKGCEEAGTKTLIVASKTWINSAEGGGWALTIASYNYDTGAPIGSPLVYPAAPSSTNYFVPTAMEASQTACGGGTDGTTSSARIIVTGYTQANSYGNNDYHTVCFGGGLGLPLWCEQYSRPGAVLTYPGLVDEEPVDIDCQWGFNTAGLPVMIAGITGHTLAGSGWDLQTVFYDADNGTRLDVKTQSGGPGTTYKACGIKLHIDGVGNYPNTRAHVVATYTNGVGPNSEIQAISYRASNFAPTSWVTDFPRALITGANLTTNAMSGYYDIGSGIEYALVAGRSAGIDESHMLLARIHFSNAPGDWYTTFSYDDGNQNTPRIGEALTIDFLPGAPSLIAIGGYTYRDANHGNDAIVCLYEDGLSQPTLRWTAWQNRIDPAFNAPDVCTAVKIGQSGLFPGDPEHDYIYVAGQVPTSVADVNIRATIFSTSTVGVTATNPDTKFSIVTPVDVSGGSSGGDIPRSFIVDPYPDLLAPEVHDVVFVGDVWNGVTTGFDILTRRFRYIEP